jgi:hypothetical protein
MPWDLSRMKLAEHIGLDAGDGKKVTVKMFRK